MTWISNYLLPELCKSAEHVGARFWPESSIVIFQGCSIWRKRWESEVTTYTREAIPQRIHLTLGRWNWLNGFPLRSHYICKKTSWWGFLFLCSTPRWKNRFLAIFCDGLAGRIHILIISQPCLLDILGWLRWRAPSSELPSGRLT